MVQLNGIMLAYLAHSGCADDLGESMDDLSKERADKKLVDRVLAGDRRAQEILIEELTPTLQWEVGKMLRKWRKGAAAGRDLAQEVADLTQEAWLAILERDYKALRDWKPHRLPLKGWVGYVARIRAAQLLRSPRAQWREEPWAPDDLPEEPGDDSPEGSMVAKNRLEAIYLCLIAKFKPIDFVLFDLYFVQQEVVEVICQQLDRKRNTVDKWRSRLSKRAEACDQLVSNWSGAAI